MFTGLTVTLFPKAGLLRWNEEEQEAEEYRDCGVSAVAFPTKEIHTAEGREVGIPKSYTVSGQVVGTRHLYTRHGPAVTATLASCWAMLWQTRGQHYCLGTASLRESKCKIAR